MKFIYNGRSFQTSIMLQIVANQHFTSAMQAATYSRQVPELFPNREVSFNPVDNAKALFEKEYRDKFVCVLIDVAVKSTTHDKILREEVNLRYSTGRCEDLVVAKEVFEEQTMVVAIPNLTQHLLAMGLDDATLQTVIQDLKDKAFGRKLSPEERIERRHQQPEEQIELIQSFRH